MKPMGGKKQVRQSRPSSHCMVVATCGLILLLSGCASRPEPSPAERKNQVVRTETERGPVKVAVEVGPIPARLSDELTLTLTIESERGVEIEKPPFGDAVGDFLIRGFREPLPKFQGEREIIRQVYTIEPIQAGTSHIDPILVRFTDRRQGEAKIHEVETDPLTLDIISEIQDVPSLSELKRMEVPRELPSERQAWPWIAGGVGLIAVAVVLFFMRRKKRASTLPEPTPAERAARELAALRQRGIRPEEAKAFYVELTAIVRRYIERTTGIQAPEQTTEEFLHEIGRGETFSLDQRQRLKDFLESADLVKFAAYQPLVEDMNESYRRAKSFVGLETREAAA